MKDALSDEDIKQFIQYLSEMRRGALQMAAAMEKLANALKEFEAVGKKMKSYYNTSTDRKDFTETYTHPVDETAADSKAFTEP